MEGNSTQKSLLVPIAIYFTVTTILSFLNFVLFLKEKIQIFLAFEM